MLELSTIWQLLQVLKPRKETPLTLIGEMWGDVVAWAGNNLLRPEFELAAADEIGLPRCVQQLLLPNRIMTIGFANRLPGFGEII